MTTLERSDGTKRTAWPILIVLGAVLAKQIAWMLWVPPGALTDEIDHYRAAETIRLAGGFVRDRAPYTGKDVSVLEDYAGIQNDRLPARSTADRRVLERSLESGAAEGVLVRHQGDGRLPGSAPGYYALAGRCQTLMAAIDVRWRWMMLRLLSAAFLLGAVWFTYAAGRVLFRNQLIPAFAGAIVVGFGPWAGFEGSLIGPGSLGAILWAAWLWQAGESVEHQKRWGALWLSLLTFALSSVGIGGLLAAVCTLGVIIVLIQRGGRSHFVSVAPGLVVTLLCLGFWIYRLVHAEGAAHPVSPTWSDIVFGSGGFAHRRPPGWIGALYMVIGVVVVGGLIAGLVQKRIVGWAVSMAFGLVVVVTLVRYALPAHAAGLPSIAPAAGLLAGSAVLGAPRKLWRGVSPAIGILVVCDLGLLLWWIQKAFS